MRQHREDRYLAWANAYLPHMKRPPSLTSFMGGPEAKPQPQTPDQMLANAQKWAALARGGPKSQANAVRPQPRKARHGGEKRDHRRAPR